MQQQCKRTCNYCSGTATTASASCFDQNTLCPTYVKNGFCQNAGYTTAIKQSTCQKVIIKKSPIKRQHLLGVILFLLAAFTCVSAQGGGFGCNNTLPANQCSTLAANCNNPAFIPFILDYCPQTCGLCPKRGCNNTLNANTCLSLAGNCNNAADIPFMLDNCPATCGFCPTTGGSLCYDVAVNCSSITWLCNNPASFQTLTQQCPYTCGRCPVNGASTLFPGSLPALASGACKDCFNCDNALNANICLSLAGNCNKTGFQPFMQNYCPNTCGFCPTR